MRKFVQPKEGMAKVNMVLWALPDDELAALIIRLQKRLNDLSTSTSSIGAQLRENYRRALSEALHEERERKRRQWRKC